MATRKMKPLHFFFPITRVDEEKRIVEGYCFVNEVVNGEGGIRLKRSAMEAATPDYMRFGATREMHQPSAVGTATAPDCGIQWDDKGAYLRSHIVDDAAWAKVKAGVYKGFSCGVAATVMRGKDVEQCVWIENSLVDRPKDPDALLTTYRAEGVDPEAETDVEVLDEESAPGSTTAESEAVPEERAAQPEIQRAASVSFAEVVADQEPQTLIYLSFDILRGLLWRIRRNDGDRETLCRTAIQEFADYITPLIAGGDPDADTDLYYAAQATLTRLQEQGDALPELLRGALAEIVLPAAPAATDLNRVQELETANADLITRAETAEGELARVQGLLSTAEERVQTLSREPAPVNNPVRYPQALNRGALAGQQTAPQATELRAELKRLEETLPTETSQQAREEGVVRMGVIKMELARLG